MVLKNVTYLRMEHVPYLCITLANIAQVLLCRLVSVLHMYALLCCFLGRCSALSFASWIV